MSCKHYQLKQCDCLGGVCFSFSGDYHTENYKVDYRNVSKDRFGDLLKTNKEIIKEKQNKE